MALDPTENSRLIGHFPTIDELRVVTRSNGVDTAIKHATINDDYSRLLYPCKEKTEGKWPDCPFTLLVVQFDEGEAEAEEGGGFTVYANDDHCHGRGVFAEKICLDFLAPGAAKAEPINLDNDESSERNQKSDGNGAVTAGKNNRPSSDQSKRKLRIVVPCRRQAPIGYTFHSSVENHGELSRVRILDEQYPRGNNTTERIRFHCRRSIKHEVLVKNGMFTECPCRMVAVPEEDSSYSIYVKGEHNHPIDERPSRVFRHRQLAAQYLNDGGESLLSNAPPPPQLEESWRLGKHRLSEKHKFIGRMHEVDIWAFFRLRGVIGNRRVGMMEKAKCLHACKYLRRTRCPYKLYTIPVEESDGKEFYVYEKGNHNEHVETEAPCEEKSGIYVQSFSSWEKVDKFRLANKLKRHHPPPKEGHLRYVCYTNGCNYFMRPVESKAPDGSLEIKLYELGEHQHRRRVAMDEPLPESVKKAKLEGSRTLEVGSAEWRTAYNIHQQFRYMSAMSQADWKAYQKENRITRNGILSFGGMKGGYYCSINPYSGCQYRITAVRDERDEDRVHVLEKGEHSDHVTINAPRGKKVKKEIPIGAGYTHFRTLATLGEVIGLTREMKLQPMTSSYEGRRRTYNCIKKCHYYLSVIQHVEDGPWESYERGEHLHPI